MHGPLAPTPPYIVLPVPPSDPSILPVPPAANDCFSQPHYPPITVIYGCSHFTGLASLCSSALKQLVTVMVTVVVTVMVTKDPVATVRISATPTHRPTSPQYLAACRPPCGSCSSWSRPPTSQVRMRGVRSHKGTLARLANRLRDLPQTL